MNEPVIDTRALDRLLAAIGGDPDDLAELIDDFSKVGEQLVRALQDGVATDDVKAIRIAAHSLKSNAREFGAGTLERLCQSLERDCESSALDGVRPLVDRIAAAFVEARAALDDQRPDRA